MMRTRRALVLLSLSIATVTAPPVLSAPTIWEPAAGGNGHFYQVVRVETGLTWKQARASAQALGSGWDLATITSAGEDAFVKSFFGSDRTFFRVLYPDWAGFFVRLGPWIGGFNVTAPDSFQWVTGEPVSYTKWVPSYIHLPADGQYIAYVEIYSFEIWNFNGVHWGHPALNTVLPIAYVAENSQSQSLNLTLSRTTVAGCRKVTGTVTLLRPAPSAGAVVTLSETLRSASSPLSLSIAAGATSGTFTITTTSVAARET